MLSRPGTIWQWAVVLLLKDHADKFFYFRWAAVVVEDEHRGVNGNGGDGGEDLRAAKRQTIGRSAGRLGRNEGVNGRIGIMEGGNANGYGYGNGNRNGNGNGGVRSRMGGRNFVLKRVTFANGCAAMDERVGGTERSHGRTFAEMDPDTGASAGAGDGTEGAARSKGWREDGQKSSLGNGREGKEGRGRSTGRSLYDGNGTHGGRSANAAATNAPEKGMYDERQRKKFAVKTSNAHGMRDTSNLASAAPSRCDRRHAQTLREEMLEYATSQMASANLNSKPMCSENNDNSSSRDGGLPNAASALAPTEQPQQNGNYIPVSSSSSSSVRGPKHVPKPKSKSHTQSRPKPSPRNRNVDLIGSSIGSNTVAPKSSKADIKAAAIMQAFAIDITGQESQGNDENERSGTHTTKNTRQQQPEERSKVERKLKRPGASAAEKAWRQRSWKRNSHRLLAPQDVPVLTLALEHKPGRKDVVAADTTDGMDVDVCDSRNETGPEKIQEEEIDGDSDGDDDDDNSSTYDTYIREPKANIKESDYKVVKVGYLTVDNSTISRQSGHRRHSHEHDRYQDSNGNGNGNGNGNEDDDASVKSQAHQRKHSANGNGNENKNENKNTYWSSVWDTWDAELELEAKVEEQLQRQLQQQSHQDQYQHHHQHQHQYSHPLQNQQQYSKVHPHPHPHAIQQLREHIRARLQREQRRLGINTRYLYDDDDYIDSGGDDNDADDCNGNGNGHGNGNGNGWGGAGAGAGGSGDVDEEDENAEGYWGADYPDEDEDGDEDEDEDEDEDNGWHEHGDEYGFSLGRDGGRGSASDDADGARGSSSDGDDVEEEEDDDDDNDGGGWPKLQL